MIIAFCGMGLGLVILALAGIGRAVDGWAAWLTFGVGVASLLAATSGLDTRAKRLGLPLLFFLVLAALWIAELSLQQKVWFTWITFGASQVYLMAVLGAEAPRVVRQRRPRPAAPEPQTA